jgi:hypothetical protein
VTVTTKKSAVSKKSRDLRRKFESLAVKQGVGQPKEKKRKKKRKRGGGAA